MNLRRQWLFETLRDIPGIPPEVLASLKPRMRLEVPPAGELKYRLPRRNGPDYRCTPAEYRGLLFRHIQ